MNIIKENGAGLADFCDQSQGVDMGGPWVSATYDRHHAQMFSASEVSSVVSFDPRTVQRDANRWRETGTPAQYVVLNNPKGSLGLDLPAKGGRGAMNSFAANRYTPRWLEEHGTPYAIGPLNQVWPLGQGSLDWQRPGPAGTDWHYPHR